MQLNALFRLAFASAPWLNHLTLLHHVTRRPILQKVRYRTEASLAVLYLLVNIRFQVLFHSPPGVLFTVPSRYYSLSVTRSYLALRDGPRIFTPDSTCPVLLWWYLRFIWFRLRDYYPVLYNFPEIFTYHLNSMMILLNPKGISTLGLGSCSFARHYSRNRLFTFFSSAYLDVSVQRVPLITLCIRAMITPY